MNESEYKLKVRKELEIMRWQNSLSMIKSNERHDLMEKIVNWHISEIKKAIEEYKNTYFCECNKSEEK